MSTALEGLAPSHVAGTPQGITSVCSAHPVVLRAALRHGRETGATVLIEATCNQVNHQGGYTGMKPADFAELVTRIAAEEECPKAQIILGGDHLGPNPWRERAATEAMREAEIMVAAYVAAGFRKIHLDCSMGCAGEPEALDDATTAQRAVQLAMIAESTAREQGLPVPLYIIGTEVPPPGGADHALDNVPPTSAEAARRTIDIHRQTFTENGLADAFGRVIGLVVQPGVEFGNHNVIQYDRALAQDLIQVLSSAPELVFEAHSTDYQGLTPLCHLVADGFAILKVGPELTFMLREALYALDLIASDLLPDYGQRPLMHAMETAMLDAPQNWQRHYHGTSAETRLLRHYSLSDRIRYYWPSAPAEAAVHALMDALTGVRIPMPLLRQHLAGAEEFADTPLDPTEVLVWYVGQTLRTYHAACTAEAS